MAQTTLPNEDFNSAIVDQEECLIDPLESYIFGYQGNLEFSYVELSCDGCEFEHNTQTFSDCATFRNSNNTASCGSCEDCVCTADCFVTNGGFSSANVILNSTEVTFKFYGEVHRVVSGSTVIDKYEWEKEFDRKVPNVTQIQEISSDRYQASNDQIVLECTNFNYVWYVNDVEEQNSGSSTFFYPQAPSCEQTVLKAEVEQSFSGGSSRSGESETFVIQPEETCCFADQSTPTVSSNSFSLGCGVTAVNLNNLHNGQIPIQSELLWSTDSDASDGLDNEVGPVILIAGEYYGYYL